MAVQRNVVAAALAGAALAGALVGCGGDKPGDNTAFGSQRKPSASTSTTAATGLAALTAKEISDQAKAALRSVSSVKVDFAMMDKGKAVQLKAAMSTSGECAGAMSQGRETMQFIGTHHVSYMKGNDAFWKDAGGRNAAGLLEVVHGKWVKVPGDAAKDKDLAAFCNLDTFLKDLASDNDHGVFSKGLPTEVNGQPVVTVLLKKPGETMTLYVASVGKPYPLKITMEGGKEPGHATFADFDKPVKAVAPPASDTVDLSRFTGDGSKNV